MHTLLRHADDLQFPGVKISVLVDEVRARRPILYLGFDSITALQATVLKATVMLEVSLPTDSITALQATVLAWLEAKEAGGERLMKQRRRTRQSAIVRAPTTTADADSLSQDLREGYVEYD
jgi:hypothetical protein